MNPLARLAARACAAGLAVACLAAPAVATARDALDDVLARRTVSIAIPTDAPPYGFVGPDAKPRGLDVDMAGLVAAGLGVGLELVPVASPDRIPMLQARRVHLVISTLGRTPERERAIDFTAAYAPFFQAVFGPRDLAVRAPADLAGRSIAVTRGTIEDEALTALAPPGTDVRRFDDSAATVAAFVWGRTLLIATGASVAGNMKAAHPQLDAEYKLLLKTSPNHIGVAKGEVRLREKVDAILADARRSGELDRLASRWLGRPANDLAR